MGGSTAVACAPFRWFAPSRAWLGVALRIDSRQVDADRDRVIAAESLTEHQQCPPPDHLRQYATRTCADKGGERSLGHGWVVTVGLSPGLGQAGQGQYLHISNHSIVNFIYMSGVAACLAADVAGVLSAAKAASGGCYVYNLLALSMTAVKCEIWFSGLSALPWPGPTCADFREILVKPALASLFANV